MRTDTLAGGFFSPGDSHAHYPLSPQGLRDYLSFSSTSCRVSGRLPSVISRIRQRIIFLPRAAVLCRHTGEISPPRGRTGVPTACHLGHRTRYGEDLEWNPFKACGDSSPRSRRESSHHGSDKTLVFIHHSPFTYYSNDDVFYDEHVRINIFRI